MNFFDAQDRARRTSRRLVIAYIVATIVIVAAVTAIVGIVLYNFTAASFQINSGRAYANADFFVAQGPVLAGTAVLTTLFILGASLFKTSVLSAGGGRVATEHGWHAGSGRRTGPAAPPSA